MRFRLPITLPAKGSAARLPVLLAPLLVALAAAQLVLPARNDLPQIGGIARVGGGQPPVDPAPVFVPGVLSGGTLFAPVTGASRAAGAAAPDPLGGVVIAGVVQRGASRLALVQGPGAVLHYVAPGGMIAGWRLVALGPGAAQLRRANEHLNLAYGAHPVSAASPQSADNSP